MSKEEIDSMKSSQQIMACISPSPSSEKVIQTAAKMAKDCSSKFIVLYVDSIRSQALSEEEKKRLNSYFNLVDQLGGEMITVYGDSVDKHIIQYAEFRNVTKIIIGKNHKRFTSIFHFHKRDLVDKIIDSNGYIDVYIIPSPFYKKEKSNFILEFSNEMCSFKEIVEAIIIMAVVALIAKLFNYMGFTDVNEIMIFILGVIVVYIKTRGYLIGTISSIIGVLIFNYLFVQPKGSLRFYDKNYITTFAIMLIVSFVIGSITNRIKKEAYNSYIREKRTEILYRASSKLLSTSGASDVISTGIEYISRLISRSVVGYLEEEGTLSSPLIYNEDKSDSKNIFLGNEKIVYWTFLNGKESGKGTEVFDQCNVYYTPVKVHSRVLGVIGISCVQGIIDREQKFIVQTIIGQMSVALDREILSSQQETSKVQIEKERLRSNLLRSVSHDLRSPLAGIKGSVSTILENGQFIDENTKKDLLIGIYDDTEWLIRLVENLLSMTRFEEGNVDIVKSMELVEDVVSEAVQRSSKCFKYHRVKVNIPENIIMVSMDGSLIEQVLINLFDNAVKFSPKGSLVEIRVHEESENVIFEVVDNGKGIPEKILPYIFDRFFTNGSKISDSRRGIGLGLAICKSIVELHGGKITAYNKKEGGAVFKFNIPREKGKEINYER